MMHKITYTMICLLVVLLFTASSKAQEITPRPSLTQNEAIRIALNFCDKAGFKVAEAPKAQFPAHLPSGIEAGHWQSYWQINFGKHFSVAVLDFSATVIGFGDGSYFADFGAYHRHVDKDSGMPPLSDEAAVEKAISIVKAMGMKSIEDPDEWTQPQVRLVQMAANDKNLDELEIMWKRLYQGIPSRNEWVIVTLQAETGELKTASVGCGIKPLHTAARESLVTVSAEQAASIAAVQLARSNIPPAVLTDIKTEILRPNGHFEAGSNSLQEAKWLRPVWICQYEYTNPQYGVFTVQVYVDAQAGQVVGGTLSGQRHGGKSPVASQIIATAKEARLYRRGKTGSWSSRPQAILSATTKPKTWQQIQKETVFVKDSHLPLGDLKIVVVGADKSSGEFNYDLRAGRLLYKGQGCVVSSELAAQLKALATSPAPAIKSKQAAAKSKLSAH